MNCGKHKRDFRKKSAKRDFRKKSAKRVLEKHNNIICKSS
jgi:hypothetical protein